MAEIFLALVTTANQTAAMGKRLQVAVFGLIVILCFFAAVAVRQARPGPKPVLFQGKSLEAWFYGARKDFFSQAVRDSAQKALNGVGTNAFPFLLAQLKAKHGTPMLYNKSYRVMPSWIRSRLPYPISTDDIRAITFAHVQQMQGHLSLRQARDIAELLPGFRNPRLRMTGLNLFMERYDIDPSRYGLGEPYRKMLDDPEPSIRVELAIRLADSAIAADPKEPRLAVILLPALERKEIRDRCLDLDGWWYQQQPPGGSGRRPGIFPPGIPRSAFPDQNESLRIRIETALIRLEPYMTPEQRTAFHKLTKTATNRP